MPTSTRRSPRHRHNHHRWSFHAPLGLDDRSVERTCPVLRARRARHRIHFLSSSSAASDWAPPSIAAIASRSEEHTSELQSLMRISYAVFCLKKKKHAERQNTT